MFVTMPSLLDTIFSLKEINPAEWVAFEQRLRKSRLLVLDDLGYERSEGWVTTKVDAIISERYNSVVSTIATTNLSAAALKGRYAEKLLDRLGSTCQPVTFAGASLREQKKA
jgi:DNA replication protein DnaC